MLYGWTRITIRWMNECILNSRPVWILRLLFSRQCKNVLGGEHKEYWEDVITSFMDKKQLQVWHIVHSVFVWAMYYIVLCNIVCACVLYVCVRACVCVYVYVRV